MIQIISNATGVDTSTLRLLLTLLGGYPTAYLYKNLYLKPINNQDKGESQRTLFLAFAGLFWAYFYNGNDIIHSLICIGITYAVCSFGVATKQRQLACGFVFVFNMIYLLVGYLFNMENDYDISWTMPHCVLCLRLIGFGFDVMDGVEQVATKKESSKDAANNKSNDTAPPKAASAPRGVTKTPVSFSGNCALPIMPSITEMLGYTYFFNGFLIGPQFSFKLYKDFIQLKNLPIGEDGSLPRGANRAALKQFLLGVFYLGAQQVLNAFYPYDFLTSSEFAQRSLFSKLIWIWMYGRACICKYIGVWLLNEGSCVVSGISYNGTDEEGNSDWGGLTNINVYGYETATALSQIIASFNINTNFWVKQYIFKRLRFLNNKDLSSLGSLIFLAIWHGVWPGYFICFFLEFLDMNLETKLTKKFSGLTAQWSKSWIMRLFLNLFGFLYTSFGLYYTFPAFTLLKWGPIYQTYSTVYFVGHIIVVGGLIVEPFVPRFKVKDSKESLKKTE